MFKYILLFAMLGLSFSAPTLEGRQNVEAKLLSDSPVEPKTPASTSKLANVIAPIAMPLIPRFAYATPVIPAITPYAYAYSAPLAPIPLAALPSSYSIEQHGYTIMV